MIKTTLKKNEKVAVIIQKHWFILLKPILWTIIFLLIAITFAITDFGTKYQNLMLYASGLTIIFTILWLFYKIIDRKTNIWAVTNLRVIDEYGVFTNNSKETPLDKINNVSFKQPILGRVFNYGEVLIQSAAESGATIHKMVERPKVLKDTITHQQEAYKQEQIKHQAQSLAGVVSKQKHTLHIAISEELIQLHKLQEKGIITKQEFEKFKEKLLNN